MTVFVGVVGLLIGFLLGVKLAPSIYLLHAEMRGVWPPKDRPWEPIEHDGWGGPEQGREHAP